MTDILKDICTRRRLTVAAAKQARPLGALESHILSLSPPRGFVKALRHALNTGHTGLIAEIKKASPSRGVIREDFDPAAIAEAYARAGATCLSVLTEREYFQGDDAYVDAARNACGLPILRKDFMLDPYQVAEARAIGADCILLIAAVLADEQMADLESAAEHYGLDVLVEVHDEEELSRALMLNTRLIGINNRDLKTLKVDLGVTERLARLIPPGYTAVCESGIGSHADILRMSHVGVHCFLVGESLMKQPDIEAATRHLLKG